MFWKSNDRESERGRGKNALDYLWQWWGWWWWGDSDKEDYINISASAPQSMWNTEIAYTILSVHITMLKLLSSAGIKGLFIFSAHIRWRNTIITCSISSYKDNDVKLANPNTITNGCIQRHVHVFTNLSFVLSLCFVVFYLNGKVITVFKKLFFMFNMTAWLDAYLMRSFQKSILFEMLLRNVFLTPN